MGRVARTLLLVAPAVVAWHAVVGGRGTDPAAIVGGTPMAVVVADNGTVVEAGGVYLIRIEETARPYIFAKVVAVGGHGRARKWVVPPGGGPDLSPDLWVKLYDSTHAETPNPSPPLGDEYAVMPISADLFLVWGRVSGSVLPVRVGTEAVTAEELAATAEGAGS